MRSETLAIVAALSFFLVGYDNSMAKLGWQSNPDAAPYLQVKLLVVIANVASVFSALVAGATADYFGRKRHFTARGALFFAGNVLKSFGTVSFGVLAVGHIFTGLGTGISLTVGPVYIAELVPARARGFFTSGAEVWLNTGVLAAYILNAMVSSFSQKVAHMAFYGIAVVLSILFTACTLAIPESPYWLLMKSGQTDEATRILENSERGPDEVNFIISQMEILDDNENQQQQQQHGVLAVAWCSSKDLFLQPPIRNVVISVVGLHVFRQLAGVNYGFKANTVTFFHQFSNEFEVLAEWGIQVVRLIFSLVSSCLVDRLGRRFMLVIGIGCQCSFLVMLGLPLLGVQHNWLKPSSGSGYDQGVVVSFFMLGLAGVLGSFEVGLGSITWIYASEVFEYKNRAHGASFGIAMNRVADTTEFLLFPYLAAWLHFGGAALVSFCLMACALVFCAKFTVEKLKIIVE
ncbi:unnamed protein product [Linum trigynum]|uniref:Major facilitator superfamily (MFS) profile domain-containing protein n=1 Tax=Linum trigynum TaxID=586398 RepID=A0AAV2DSP4_9ROSI